MHVTRTTLANGLTLLVQHEPASEIVAIVTYVRAGYFDETDDIVGISHVLEHMFFKGTPRFGVGEIAKATKSAGGYLNAHTIYDHTSYYTVLPARTFARGLEIQADAYANSLIDPTELARELEVIIQEAKRKADNPSAVATETLYELLHDRHRMRRWRIGREQELRGFTSDAVRRFYRAFYTPSNTVLSIAGGVRSEDALAAVERLYGSLEDRPIGRSRGPAEERAAEFRYREVEGDVQQTQLLFGWRAPALLDAAAPPLDLAATVLGAGRASRLYRAVRERQLASSVGADNYTLPELGVFVVHAEGEPQTTLDAARAAWGEVARLREAIVEDHEIARAKRLYEARWLRSLESMEGRASFVAAWEALGGWELGPAYLDSVLTATAGSLREVANSYLSPESAGALTYRPRTAPRIAGDADALREALGPQPFTVPVSTAPTPQVRSAPATAELEHEIGGVCVYRTARGLPLLVMRRRGLGFVYAGVYTGAGAAADPAARAGLTLLLARCAVKGTRSRSAVEIAEDAERLGGTIAAAPSGDALGWSMSVPRVAAADALELLADVSQRAVFPAEALEVERAVALSDLAALRDDMMSYPLRLMTRAAFGGHGYATPTLGTEDGLRSVSRADLLEAHGERLVRGAAVVAIVGDDDPDQLARTAAGAFSELAVGSIELPESPTWHTGATCVEERDKAQTAVAVALPAPGRRHPERYAMELIVKIASGLGGRFFDELRDRRSLAYTVHAFTAPRPRAGLFATYIATSPDREAEAREGVLSEIARLRDDPPSDEEVRRAREYAVGTELIRRESGSALLSEIVDAWLFGALEELGEYEEKMRAITTADLDAVITSYLDPERAAFGVVRGK